VILTYHRIADGPDPLLQCVPPGLFAEQLDVLRAHAAIVPLADVAAGTIAITFDDGYADNATAAAPLLAERGVPATFFVPSRIVDDGREYWWDRLEHAHFDAAPRTDQLDTEIAGTRLRVDVRTAEGRQRSHKAVNRRLRRLPVAEADSLADSIARQLGADPSVSCARHALLDRDAIAALAAEPLFEIGSHGIGHSMLSALDDREQLHELTASREALETVTGEPVTSVAYPYGTTDAYTGSTFALAQRAGYQRACVNTPGRIGAPFALPRHMVYAWDGDELSSKLREWFRRA
jgi:peptidoglycan/xylan/chitin deacetylase (PgdA/CDA1 family)